jgi:hypothetical protein
MQYLQTARQTRCSTGLSQEHSTGVPVDDARDKSSLEASMALLITDETHRLISAVKVQGTVVYNSSGD